MADRAANRGGVGTRLTVFARSLILLGVIAVGIPWALVFAARERFGGGAPMHGVPSPADWRLERIRAALTDRLTDQTIADIVIRLALLVAWAGVIVIVLTVIAELFHMLRHDGLAMPDIRGLGFTQRTARVIASGLLVLVPLFTSPAGAIARDMPNLLPDRAASAAPVGESPSTSTATPTATVHSNAPTAAPNTRSSAVAPTDARPDAAGRVASTRPTETGVADTDVPQAPVSSGDYVVRPGDSIFGIAERLAGPNTTDVAAFAEQLIDLNLGREMPDGRHFNNAAFIDVGWVLQLPADADAGASASAAVTPGAGAEVHVVEEGESLWSIADEEFGDPLRWPEVYEANEGRTFDDGRQLTDPDLIHPGWDLRLSADEVIEPAVDEVVEPAIENTEPEPLVDVGPGELAPPHPEQRIPSHMTDVLDADHPANASEAIAAPAPARRDNVWEELSTSSGRAEDAASVGAAAVVGAPTDRSGDAQGGASAQHGDSSRPAMLALGAGAMLSAGVLALLATRRRRQLRRARPRATLPAPAAGPAATERVLRAIDAGARFERVEVAVRSVAAPLVAAGRRVSTVLVGTDGSLELRATGPVELAAPWEGGGATWTLAASSPDELLVEAARGVAAPCPTLVQLGTAVDGRDVYVDLEAIEALEVGGPGVNADSIVAAVAATLAGSLLAEVTTLVGLGVADDAFLGHRLYAPVREAQRAFETAADAIGSTATMNTSTFELRTSGSAGETWEPAVVLVGSAAGTITPPASRVGLAVVSASPLHGPSSRLAPDGDAWRLLPADIRLTPVGVTPDDLSAIAELVTVIEPAEPDFDRAALDGDHTIVPGRDAPEPSIDAGDEPGARDGDEPAETEIVLPEVVPEPATAGPGVGVPADPPTPYALLVRLLGPVEVVDVDGEAVSFERSKTRELVAWLATHRERSTRGAARTALWELDVRDATFANVVSEARRSLARLVEPAEGEEWVGRTMTDALPLHPLVRTDVDVIRDALDAARVQPPAQAIATLGPAVDLIAGLPFEGTSYLWPDSEGITSNLVLLATTATTELAAHCLSVGDIEGVFRATGRGLQVLPAHEELIGLRMEAHARAGDHAGVRQEWESYERVINADPWSDGEPAPKLVELRQRLLNPSR